MDIESFISKLDKDDPFIEVFSKSVRIIENSLAGFTDSISLSFNGGKDACVIFHMLRYVLYKNGNSNRIELSNKSHELYIPNVYFSSSKEFPEVITLMEEMARRYNIEYLTFSDMSFQSGMEICVNEKGRRAIIMGMRYGDPFCPSPPESVDNNSDSNYKIYYHPSSNGWPEFTRVYPILDWSYHNGEYIFHHSHLV